MCLQKAKRLLGTAIHKRPQLLFIAQGQFGFRNESTTMSLITRLNKKAVFSLRTISDCVVFNTAAYLLLLFTKKPKTVSSRKTNYNVININVSIAVTSLAPCFRHGGIQRYESFVF